ncbi:glycosyltransferase [Cetobacterium sp.]|uniref:glycosyltransferase n=1 Tax=Cetobacterium sp. TaxID=2071632 RepID=UPI003F2E8968
MKPLVTVIILTYNRFEYIKDAIESVLSQDYENIEIIISDDASKNFDIKSIKEILSKSKKNIKRTEIIVNERNLGTVKNYNNAIKISKGEYFIGLASDDIFRSDSIISEIVNIFEEGSLIVTAKRGIYTTDLKNRIEVLPQKKEVEFLKNKSSKEIYYYLLKRGNFISGASTYYSRKLFEKYGLFDEEFLLLEDYPYYLNLFRNGECIKIYDKESIKYRMGGVTSGKIKNYKLLKDMELLGKREKKYNLKNYFIKRVLKSFEIKNQILKIIFYPDVIFIKFLEQKKMKKGEK